MKQNLRAFIDEQRVQDDHRPIASRLQDFQAVELPLTDAQLHTQAERCMNCGIPFCQGCGCPLKNEIPDINAAAFRGDWRTAWAILSRTSSFPEFTSRICPALCEGSCTSGLAREAVMVRQIEKTVTDKAFSLGLVMPPTPATERGAKVAVIGAGPAGMATAAALRKKGYAVTVFEKSKNIGGLLRYGIPYFKFDKVLIDRRRNLLERAGIEFKCGAEIGVDISGAYLQKNFDAVVVCIGTPVPRNCNIPGRELQGIHFALEFLGGQNRFLGKEQSANPIDTRGKRVLVIGGGDTGADCVGTSNRQGAASVTQIEIMPCPPEKRDERSTPWPLWPYQLRTSTSHEEGCERRWNLNSLAFLGHNGSLTGVRVQQVKWSFTPEGRPAKFEPVPNSEEEIQCDICFLAMGFLRNDRTAMLKSLGLEDSPSLFFAGDAASGASLVVRAIASGRATADAVDNAHSAP